MWPFGVGVALLEVVWPCWRTHATGVGFDASKSPCLAQSLCLATDQDTALSYCSSTCLTLPCSQPRCQWTQPLKLQGSPSSMLPFVSAVWVMVFLHCNRAMTETLAPTGSADPPNTESACQNRPHFSILWSMKLTTVVEAVFRGFVHIDVRLHFLSFHHLSVQH